MLDPHALPPGWRGHIETASPRVGVVAVLLAIAGALLGSWLNRRLPLRRCSNCEQVVCRCCAERRRELALCRSCALIDTRTEAPDFARMLLKDQRKKVQRIPLLLRTVGGGADPRASA